MAHAHMTMILNKYVNFTAVKYFSDSNKNIVKIKSKYI